MNGRVGVLATQAPDSVCLLQKTVTAATQMVEVSYRTSPYTRVAQLRFKTARVTHSQGNDHWYTQLQLHELEPAEIEHYVQEGRLMETDYCASMRSKMFGA